MKTYFTAFTTSIQDPQMPDVTYYDIINATDGTLVHDYPLRPNELAAVAAMAKQIERAQIGFAALDTLDDDLTKPPSLLTQRASLDR